MNDRAKKPKGLGGGTRLAGLIRKEFLQIVRDPSSIGIAFFMPVLLLLLFGYGVSLDARDVSVAVVVEQPDGDTQDFVASLGGSGYLRPVHAADMPDAERAMRAGEVDAIVRLRGDFSRRLYDGREAPVQAVVNGVDANTARIISGYVQGAWRNWLAQRALAAGGTLEQPVETAERVWYNSELRSRNFLVPGLMAVIMTLIGALLTAMVTAREWDRGTMESLLTTPVRSREILLGKLVPYFVLGCGGMGLTVAMAVFVFDVPLRGSAWTLLGAGALFLLVTLGMGLLISAVTRDQFVAGQVAIITTFLPSFLLSGFMFDIHTMPLPVRIITHVIAARYFVTILQTVFLAGDVWSVIIPNALALVAMAVIFLGLARLKLRRGLM